VVRRGILEYHQKTGARRTGLGERRDPGIVSVHFAGLPPGTAALMVKCLPPDVLERFGGPENLQLP